MAKFSEKFWLWGQDAGSHHAAGNNMFKLPGVNRMGPAEGAAYLGLQNVCRVVCGGVPVPPFDNETKQLTNMRQVVWSAVGSSGTKRNDANQSDLEEVFRQAKMFPNVTGAVLDDFFNGFDGAGKLTARHSVASIRNMHERLHHFEKRPLDLWLVWYKHHLDYDASAYLEYCDVITFWTWDGADLPKLDETLGKVMRQTPGKRRLAGCYMWDYGGGKPFTIAEMKFQCEKYYAWMGKGLIEGIIFCSNCCADIGLEAVEWTRNWIKEVGNE